VFRQRAADLADLRGPNAGLMVRRIYLRTAWSGHPCPQPPTCLLLRNIAKSVGLTSAANAVTVCRALIRVSSVAQLMRLT
jgi:hypothetical protein